MKEICAHLYEKTGHCDWWGNHCVELVQHKQECKSYISKTEYIVGQEKMRDLLIEKRIEEKGW